MSKKNLGFAEHTRVPFKLGKCKPTSDWVMLDGFHMNQQCHTNWCWAAVGEAIAQYYDPDEHYGQKDIARMEMPEFDYREDCFLLGGEKADELLPYNVPRVLMSVLLQIECYDHGYDPDVPAPLKDVQAWIDGDESGRRAVCVRIKWPNRKSHFITIDGYRRSTDWLHIWDPDTGGATEIRYDHLLHYKDVGRWVDTLYTARVAS